MAEARVWDTSPHTEAIAATGSGASGASSQASEVPAPQHAAFVATLDELQRQGKLDPLARSRFESQLAQIDATTAGVLLGMLQASLNDQPAGENPAADATEPSVSAGTGEFASKPPGNSSAGQGIGPTADPTAALPRKSTAGRVERLPPPPWATNALDLAEVLNHVYAGQEQGATAEAQQADAASSQAPATGGPAETGNAESARHNTKARPVSHAPEAWRQALDRAIERLEEETSQEPQTLDEAEDHIRLRLLYLLAGRREEALRPVPGIPPAHQEFWLKELYGLETCLDSRKIPNAARRAREALRHLQEASTYLGEAATLTVRNLALCTAVKSYGVIVKFPTNEFAPLDELLLYAEVEHFKSEATGEGYRTSFRARYEIFDAAGQRVTEHDLPDIQETCQNRRRDYFMSFHIQLPERIYPGRHTLRLTIEDVPGQKIGMDSVEFVIKEK
jgi:hypothetical protein